MDKTIIVNSVKLIFSQDEEFTCIYIIFLFLLIIVIF